MVEKIKEKSMRALTQKPKAEEKVEEVYRQEAERLGITFNGLLKWPDKKRSPLPMFTDTVSTRSSFTTFEGETTESALARIRKHFYDVTAEEYIRS